MKCPNCLAGELTKTKVGYMCLNCGYHSKTAKGLKETTASSSKSSGPKSAKTAVAVADIVMETDNVSAQESKPGAAPLPAPIPPVAVPKSDPASATELHDPESHEFKPPRPVRTATLMIVGLFVVVVLALAYVVPAASAARDFNEKLAAASSFRLRGNLTVKAQSFLSVLNSNLNFNGNVSTKGDQFNYQGLFASRNYSGQLITTKGQLYTKMTGSDLPFIRYNQGISTYHILPDTWYQTKIDTSLYKYYCETRPNTKYPSPIVWYQAMRQIKLKPSAVVSFGESIDGHSTTHLRGTINGHDLNNAWANINSGLPPGCQWSDLIEDVSGLKVNYDLWTSPKFDRIILHFNDKDLGVGGSITLNMDQYNQAAAPTVPGTVQDLSQIFALRADIQTRDYQRRTQIDALNVAIKSYYASNKQKLPTSLAKLSPTYIASIPTDPKGVPYSYSVTNRTYTLSTTLEDAGQQYVVTGP